MYVFRTPSNCRCRLVDGMFFRIPPGLFDRVLTWSRFDVHGILVLVFVLFRSSYPDVVSVPPLRLSFSGHWRWDASCRCYGGPLQILNLLRYGTWNDQEPYDEKKKKFLYLPGPSFVSPFWESRRRFLKPTLTSEGYDLSDLARNSPTARSTRGYLIWS